MTPILDAAANLTNVPCVDTVVVKASEFGSSGNDSAGGIDMMPSEPGLIFMCASNGGDTSNPLRTVRASLLRFVSLCACLFVCAFVPACILEPPDMISVDEIS